MLSAVQSNFLADKWVDMRKGSVNGIQGVRFIVPIAGTGSFLPIMKWCMCLSAGRIDQLQSCIRGFLSSKRTRESWIRPIKIDIYEVNQELVHGHSGIPYCNYMPSPNQQFDIEIKLLLVRTNPVTSHLAASVSIGGIAYSLIRFRCSCFTYPQWSSKRVASIPATKKNTRDGYEHVWTNSGWFYNPLYGGTMAVLGFFVNPQGPKLQILRGKGR